MMNTIHTTGFGSGFALLGIVHVLSVVLFFVGVIFLIQWSLKTLNQKQLKLWGVSLVLAGILLSLLTVGAFPGAGRDSCMMDKSGMGMGCMQMDDDMMGDDEMMEGMDHSKMNMDMDDDAMSMSMDDMSAMLEGKTGDDFDEAFLQGMIPHHQGAIDMAVAAKASAKHDEIKRMADAIISAQQQEIDQMNQWMKDWGYTE